MSDAVLFLANAATLRNRATLIFRSASTLSFSSSGPIGILDALGSSVCVMQWTGVIRDGTLI
jgi:hypothetical protein